MMKPAEFWVAEGRDFPEQRIRDVQCDALESAAQLCEQLATEHHASYLQHGYRDDGAAALSLQQAADYIRKMKPEP